MKLSTLRGEVTVPKDVKRFALIISILESMFYGDRNALIKRIARYYEVTL